MPKFSAEEVYDLVQRMKCEHKRVEEYRRIVDRDTAFLQPFKQLLAEQVQPAWTPYMSPKPVTEKNRLKHLMVANPGKIQVMVRTTNSKLAQKGQDIEHWLEAVDERLFPVVTQLKMLEMLTDSYAVVSLEPCEPGENLKGYADRDALEKHAESDGDDEDTDVSPKANYRRAYRGTDAKKTRTERHLEAYDKVTGEAQLMDGLSLRVRVVDPATFHCWSADIDDDGAVSIGCEMGRKSLNPLLKTFATFGLKRVGDRLVLEGGYDSPSYGAIGDDVAPEGTPSYGSEDFVDYIQLRTYDTTYILIEHPGESARTAEDRGVLITFDNPFGGKSTGYYVLGGDEKMRPGKLEDRYDPPLLGLLTEAMHLSIIQTAMETMALEEASRPLAQIVGNDAGVPPVEPTQESKTGFVEDGEAMPVAVGEIKRAETTGIKLNEVHDIVNQALHEMEARDLWAGSGSSGETGIHLARLQTALLTQLTPYQHKRAALHKRILLDVLSFVHVNDETIRITHTPSEKGEDNRSMIRTMTPDLAKMPIDLIYTIGSDTPESDYARMQVSASQMQLGTWGMTRHRENCGVKDPQAEDRQLAIDNAMSEWIGTAERPGHAQRLTYEILAKYVEASAQRYLGPLPVTEQDMQPPAPQPQMMLGPDGMPMQPIPGMGMMPGQQMPMQPPAPMPANPLGSPIQTNPAQPMLGQPVAPGGAPMPA